MTAEQGPEVEMVEELSGVLEAPSIAIDGGLVVRPGDVVLVEADERITAEDAQHLVDRLLARLPGVRDVVVLGGCRVRAVYRPEDGR